MYIQQIVQHWYDSGVLLYLFINRAERKSSQGVIR